MGSSTRQIWLEMGDAALLRPVSYSIWQDDQRQFVELVVFGLASSISISSPVAFSCHRARDP